MYQVGDKVVYPVHGAGEVVAIERREVAGCRRDYYILSLPFSGLTVAVPQAEAGRLGLRGLMSDGEAGRVVAILSGEEEAERLPEKWNSRARLLVDKIKGGDVCELAVVVRNLSERERARALANGEKRLFEQARDILLSELKMLETKDDMRRRIGDIVNELEEIR